jgi:signal transduction histidine kinase
MPWKRLFLCAAMRKVSLRTKLVLLILALAAMPLTITLVGGTMRGRQMRIESAGQAIATAASGRTSTFSVSLAGEIDKLLVGLQHEPAVYEFLSKPPRELTEQQRKVLDDQWPTLPTDHGPLSEVLNHPIARQLQLITEDDNKLVEILVTDRLGQLVAATGRTTDFYQADGKGSVYVLPIDYDASTGVWAVVICLPIRDLSSGEVIGVAKAVMDLSQWFERLSVPVAKMRTSVVLLRPNGSAIYQPGRDGRMAPPAEIKDIPMPMRLDAPETWHVSQNGFLYACSEISLPSVLGGEIIKMPSWSLTLYMPMGLALREINLFTATVLLAGLLIVVVLFMGGLFLIDRGVVRRVRALAEASHKVAEGDLSHRIESTWPKKRLLGRDEIDDLAGDFDLMVEKIHQSYASLKEADDLKTNFIRIAGHEFRTPISYILGMTRLLKDSRDPDKLLHGVQMMGAKAKRLDDITQAMFRLMPDAPYAQALRYSEIAVPELLEEVYLDCYPFVDSRKQKLVVQADPRLPLVRGDRFKLRDAIESLAMNAIKFTPDGGEVRLEARHEADNLVIEVIDQGPGVSPSDLPHIFMPFFTTANVMRHSSGQSEFEKRGMGLGLTVVKHFAVLHGGTVSVKTGPKGSVFTLQLPIRPQGER